MASRGHVLRWIPQLFFIIFFPFLYFSRDRAFKLQSWLSWVSTSASQSSENADLYHRSLLKNRLVCVFRRSGAVNCYSSHCLLLQVKKIKICRSLGLMYCSKHTCWSSSVFFWGNISDPCHPSPRDWTKVLLIQLYSYWSFYILRQRPIKLLNYPC